MSTIDEQQRRLTSDALAALADTDFALAGSGAIREHGISDRPTQDVDLFTSSLDPQRFDAAVEGLTGSLVSAGYTVEVVRRAPTFARLQIRTATGSDLELDLGVDWRSTAPAQLAVGPVLAVEDAVGSKISALYSRAETRDFLDVDAIRRSGPFTDDELLAIVAHRDPGFDRATFAAQLEQARQLTAAEVGRYGVPAEQLADVQGRLLDWARHLRNQPEAGQA